MRNKKEISEEIAKKLIEYFNLEHCSMTIDSEFDIVILCSFTTLWDLQLKAIFKQVTLHERYMFIQNVNKGMMIVIHT